MSDPGHQPSKTGDQPPPDEKAAQETATHRATRSGGWFWLRIAIILSVIGFPLAAFWLVMTLLFNVDFAFLFASAKVFSVKVFKSTIAIISTGWRQVLMRFSSRRGWRWGMRLLAILFLPQTFKLVRRPSRWLWRQVRGGIGAIQDWYAALGSRSRMFLWSALTLLSIGVAVATGWLWLLLPPPLWHWIGRKATDLLPDTLTRLGGWERRLERRAIRAIYRGHRRWRERRRNGKPDQEGSAVEAPRVRADEPDAPSGTE